MPGRGSDQRRPDILATIRAISERVEELRKAIARGVPALRAPSGATLALVSRDAGSTQLVPRGADGTPGAVSVTLEVDGGRVVEPDGPQMMPWAAATFTDTIGPLRSTSEQSQKLHDRDIAGALAVVRQWRPALWRWREGEHPHPDVLRAGCYVDEVDSSTDGTAVAGVDARGNRAPDPLAMIAYLAAAVVELADLVEARLPPPT